MRPIKLFKIFYFLIILVSVSGCAVKYFHDAAVPIGQTVKYPLHHWPYEDYWTGIVFNGRKIGFSHLSVSSSIQPDIFDIRSEAALRFRLLTLDKSALLKSYDQVDERLSIIRFEYAYDMDGNLLKLVGRRVGNRLMVNVISRGEEKEKIFRLNHPVYPSSAIGLYPVFHGLAVGNRYEFPVFDGETQTIDTVKQEIVGYETSELFKGKAYKIITRYHGQEVTTWLDAKGRPVLEMSLGGILIAGLETEQTAKQHLAQAALNKDESFIEYSLIKTEKHIENPGRVKSMQLLISGIKDHTQLPDDHRQECMKKGNGWFCRVFARTSIAAPSLSEKSAVDVNKYLQPSFVVPSRNPSIIKTAREIAKDILLPDDQIERILDWIHKNIEQTPVDVFTALDVLHGKKAECQGHTYLYTAFARSLGIPSRVVNGIVYSSVFGGFLYHTWAESFINHRWIAVDPTFHQKPADATHIKLIEGETPSELLPLVNLIGKISVEIVEVSEYE